MEPNTVGVTLSQPEKPRNWFIRLFTKIGGVFKSSGVYVGDFAEDVFKAFMPIMKTTAAAFVTTLKEDAIQIVMQAEEQGGGTRAKISYFATELAKVAVKRGYAEVKDHWVNLLREVVIAELKNRGTL